jgi:two-component system, chemotaxis family, CheB/CheR fusion protein
MTPTQLTVPRLRVLVVDDEPDTRVSMALLLCLWGHEHREAADGPAALAAALAFHPHVVFLDIGLAGGMHGNAVAGRLRHDPELEGVLLVAISGYGDPISVAQGEKAGCDCYLVKPADPQQLRQILREHAARLADRGGGRVERGPVVCRN